MGECEEGRMWKEMKIREGECVQMVNEIKYKTNSE